MTTPLEGPAPRWFTIPAPRPFLTDLASGLLDALGREGLGEAVVLLPSRRSARALAEAFVTVSGGQALLLPQIRALGDRDEGEPPFEPGELALGLPAAVTQPCAPPAASMISWHSPCVLVSHHSLAVARTWPSAPTGTKPCCCPETPTAATDARNAGSSCPKQKRIASIHQSAFCSRLPSAPVSSSSARLCVATTGRSTEA